MALLRYTVLRVLLFLAVAALLWIVGLRGLWLVMFAILISGMISIFALSRSRDAASVSLATRAGKIKQRLEERAAAEDAWDEQQRESAASGSRDAGAVNPAESVGGSPSARAAPGRDLRDLEDTEGGARLRDEA
jgi:hypothetical protein